MKKKKLIGVLITVCIVLVAAGAVFIFNRKNSGENGDESQSAVVSDTENSENESGAGEENGSSADGSAEDDASDASEKVGFEVVDGSNAVLEDEANGSGVGSGMPDGSEWRNSPGSQGAEGTETDNTQGNNTESNVITFPYTIPNTNLTIQNITSYDGVFLEDGSDSDVSGIASMVLKNSGSSNVEYANITLNCNGTQLTFEVSDITAGSSVVVQEANKAAYTAGTYTDCSADVAEIDGFEMSSDKVKVEENEDGSLTVVNLTGEEIPCVRVFYKFYMDDENAYVGGITYTAKMTNLEANGSQKVTPSHYSAGYSKVVMIRTYDTTD